MPFNLYLCVIALLSRMGVILCHVFYCLPDHNTAFLCFTPYSISPTRLVSSASTTVVLYIIVLLWSSPDPVPLVFKVSLNFDIAIVKLW